MSDDRNDGCEGGVGDALYGAVGDIDTMANRLEEEVEAVLGHPCRAVVEEIDPSTGKARIRVELDLAELRDRLKGTGEFQDVDVGISDDFVFEIQPEPDEQNVSRKPSDVSTETCE